MVLFGGLLFTACTKDNFIHTGTSKGRFEGSLMEYMEAHPYELYGGICATFRRRYGTTF